MKIRTGFVSNSSSSSFCIVGVRGNLVRDIAKGDVPQDEEEDPEEEGSWDLAYGCGEGMSGLIYYGDCESDVVGLVGKPLLETMSLKEARVKVRTLIRASRGIDVPLNRIDLLYGEAGNG